MMCRLFIGPHLATLCRINRVDSALANRLFADYDSSAQRDLAESGGLRTLPTRFAAAARSRLAPVAAASTGTGQMYTCRP